jgi:hypothetical protein
MTVAVDSTGVIHVAAALAQGNPNLLYGRCAGRCDEASSWEIVPLPSKADVHHTPTIALTDDDRPRILFGSDEAGSAGYYYLQCDAACARVASWYSVRLTKDTPEANGITNPRMPFAVSGDGAAAFAYDDGFGMYVWICSSRCAAGNSWKWLKLAGVYNYAEAVAFGSGGSLQIAGRQPVPDSTLETLSLFDCPGRCGSGSSWGHADRLWLTQGEQTMALARTAKGGPRVLVYGDDPNTAVGSHVFAYLSCDTRCRNPASWNPAVAPPLTPDSASVGFALALNDTGQTVVATVGDSGSSLARCLRDCAGPTGTWQMAPGVGVPDLEARLPPTVPASCLSATWGMYGGPSLAVDPKGTPLVAFTAYVKAFGGDCGTGSLATTSDSFVFAGP